MADISVVFAMKKDKDGPFYLTNGPGWSAVCSWAESAAGERFSHLAELAKHGKIAGTVQLGVDLAGAIVLAPSKIRGILQELAERLGVGDAEETLVVTDGCDGGEDTP